MEMIFIKYVVRRKNKDSSYAFRRADSLTKVIMVLFAVELFPWRADSIASQQIRHVRPLFSKPGFQKVCGEGRSGDGRQQGETNQKRKHGGKNRKAERQQGSLALWPGLEHGDHLTICCPQAAGSLTAYGTPVKNLQPFPLVLPAQAQEPHTENELQVSHRS